MPKYNLTWTEKAYIYYTAEGVVADNEDEAWGMALGGEVDKDIDDWGTIDIMDKEATEIASPYISSDDTLPYYFDWGHRTDTIGWDNPIIEYRVYRRISAHSSWHIASCPDPSAAREIVNVLLSNTNNG